MLKESQRRFWKRREKKRLRLRFRGKLRISMMSTKIERPKMKRLDARLRKLTETQRNNLTSLGSKKKLQRLTAGKNS